MPSGSDHAVFSPQYAVPVLSPLSLSPWRHRRQFKANRPRLEALLQYLHQRQR